jgi:uncharacterized membrane protein YwaF
MKEFFGFGGYQRPAEGFLSTEHIVFVSTLVAIMIFMAAFIGMKNKDKDYKTKNKVLIASAILIDSLELFKIIIFSIRGNDPFAFLYELPLFLCSIQLITIPLAAFAKGRLKESSLDFVLIFGILGALFGTYGAGNNYSSYPVLSFDNVISGLTHTISGFASLYIAISGMVSMEKKNMKISFTILFSFCIMAYIANVLLDYNYMFLMRGDGTPYDYFYNFVEGSKVLYPLIVVGLFLIYISGFYFVYYSIKYKSITAFLRNNSNSKMGYLSNR